MTTQITKLDRYKHFKTSILMLLFGPLSCFLIATQTGCEDAQQSMPEPAESGISTDIASVYQPAPNPKLLKMEQHMSESASALLVPGPIARSELTSVAAATKSDDLQENQEPVKAKPGLLDRASGLLQRAKQKGGQSAKSANDWVQDKIKDATGTASDSSEEAMKWANGMYESLKAKGMTNASDTSEWLSNDWNNMESWEYKVISCESLDNQQLEDKLNQLGEQGWECFDTSGDRLMLKKPRESYLRRLPFKDLLQLAPLINLDQK